jgi:hypothetical protein
VLKRQVVARAAVIVAGCVLAFVAAVGCDEAEHSGGSPGDAQTSLPTQPPSSGPFAGHYGPACLDAATLTHCADILGFTQNSLTSGAERLAHPTEVNVVAGRLRALCRYWADIIPTVDAMKDIDKGIPSFRIARETATSLDLVGSGERTGWTISFVYETPPTTPTPSDHVYVTARVSSPLTP